MPNLTPLCRAVESTAGLAAVEAQWRAALGDQWPWARALLRAGGELAAVYPKLEPDPPSARPYDVVCHDVDADDYVGVCPDGTGRLPLRAADLVLLELDVGGLAARAAAALDLVADFERIGGLTHTYRAGFFNPLGGDTEAWVYLALPTGPEQVEAALASLVLRHAEPFLLLTPTRASWRAWPEPLRRRGVVAALDEVFTVDAAGTFSPAVGLPDLLGPVWRACDRAGRGRPAGTQAAPALGLLRLEDVRAAYPNLDDRQVDRVRKDLEAWRNQNEDAVMMSDENPPGSGRRRYAYPADVVARAVAKVLAGGAARRR